MDLSGVEAIIPPLAQYFNIEPATMLLITGVTVTVANVLSRVIPDDAKGILGGVRKVASVIGVYVSNRVTSGVTTNDVVREVVGVIPVDAAKKVEELASQDDALIPKVTDVPTVAAFPGLQNDESK